MLGAAGAPRRQNRLIKLNRERTLTRRVWMILRLPVRYVQAELPELGSAYCAGFSATRMDLRAFSNRILISFCGRSAVKER